MEKEMKIELSDFEENRTTTAKTLEITQLSETRKLIERFAKLKEVCDLFFFFNIPAAIFTK